METSRSKGVVIMTASDYVESTLYHQREQAMNIRNERRRIVLERLAVRPTTHSLRTRRGLSHLMRHRLSEL